MKKRSLALLLTLALVLSLLSPAVLAADGAHITVSAGAPTETTLSVGGLFTLDLNTVFTDTQGHTLSYTLDQSYGSQTYIKADGTLVFSVSEAGVYSPVITASCGSDSATHTITVEATAASDGMEEQYGYDETPASQVSVWVTVSSDGMPIQGLDEQGTVLSHRRITVPYFDLALYGLQDYYRYGTEGGSGEYVNETVIQRPTALHLYLYLLERYYLGLPESECCKGTSGVLSYSDETDVLFMDGSVAYQSLGRQALQLSGGPTSLYMNHFWGHDENLMYYRNHVYPLMKPGWGSTCDYILLSDGDTVDVAMFTDWSFWQRGAFACFDQDSYLLEPGASLDFQTQRFGTRSVADGGPQEILPISGLSVGVYNENWELLDSLDPVAIENSYRYTFPEEGEYYLMATDPYAGNTSGSEMPCFAPATARVTVTKLTLTALEITEPPVNRVYGAGEAADPTGMTVTAVYNGVYRQELNEGYTCAINAERSVMTVSYTDQGVTQTAEIAVTCLSDPAPELEDGWYLLGSTDQLFWFANRVNACGARDSNARLMTDLDLTGRTWTPIGTKDAPFSGGFDGQRHTISGLTLEETVDYGGLFGVTNGAVLEGLTLAGSVQTQAPVAGALCGLAEQTQLRDLLNTASLQGAEQAGGLVGCLAEGSVLTRSANEGAVTAATAGGLCGVLSGGEIVNCYNTGAVQGPAAAGGMAGTADGRILNGFSTGQITGAAGALVGRAEEDAVLEHLAYLEGVCAQPGDYGTALQADVLNGTAYLDALNANAGKVCFQLGAGHPVFLWQEAPAVISLSAERTTLSAGETVTISWMLDATLEHVAALQLKLYYNSKLFRLEAWSCGESNPAIECSVQKSDAAGDYYELLYVNRSQGDSDCLTQGTLLRLRFTALAGLTEETAAAFTPALVVAAASESFSPLAVRLGEAVQVTVQPAPTDRAALEALVKQAKGLDASDYTAESWAALQRALETAEAVLADQKALQTELDAAAAALRGAMDALVGLGDKTALLALIEQAEALDQTAYALESWDALCQALGAAQTVADQPEALQAAIDQAYHALQAALDGLLAIHRADWCPSGHLTDVNQSYWYHAAVDFALDRGLMKGDSATTFSPEGTLTRAQLVTILHRLAGSPAVTGENPFRDVPDGLWYSQAILWASSNGIAKGMTTETFEPDTPVTREQLVTFFARYAQWLGLPVTAEGDLSGFTDADRVSGYAGASMAWAVGVGLIKGMEHSTLQPLGTSTRAQIAQILLRWYCLYL